MSDPHKGTTRVPNAFSDDFLQLDLERNEPAEADDPSGEGPWSVQAVPSGLARRDWPEWEEVHGLWRPGRRPERGDASPFLATGRSLALYASLARPIAGRDPSYQLGQERWRGGFPLRRHGRPQAWMETFFPEWALLTSALTDLGQRPYDVAVFLEAIGPSCRRVAGEILHERLTAGSDG